MKLNLLAPWKKSYDQPRQHIKKQRHYFTDKDPYSQSHVFPDVTDGCESWTIKNGIKLSAEELMLLVLEKTLESPLDCKEILPVHPKGNQS